MKKIIALFLLLFSLAKPSSAQDTTSIAGKMQFVFAQLNRNEIFTGFLEERGFPLVSLRPFNGILTYSNRQEKH